MKKLISVILIIALTLTFALTLTGCARHGVCEHCGQNERLVKFTYPSDYSVDEPIWVCDDCFRWCKFLYGGTD